VTATSEDDRTSAARLTRLRLRRQGRIMKTIDDLEVSGKRVLLRADLNVPPDTWPRPRRPRCRS